MLVGIWPMTSGAEWKKLDVHSILSHTLDDVGGWEWCCDGLRGCGIFLLTCQSHWHLPIMCACLQKRVGDVFLWMCDNMSSILEKLQLASFYMSQINHMLAFTLPIWCRTYHLKTESRLLVGKWPVKEWLGKSNAYKALISVPQQNVSTSSRWTFLEPWVLKALGGWSVTAGRVFVTDLNFMPEWLKGSCLHSHSSK